MGVGLRVRNNKLVALTAGSPLLRAAIVACPRQPAVKQPWRRHSSIPSDGNYSAAASADDLKGVLDFLNITFTCVFVHEKGVGMAVALAAQYPASYLGPTAFSEDTVSRYISSIQKPGFLRAMLGLFTTASISTDEGFFKQDIGTIPAEYVDTCNRWEGANFVVEPLLRQGYGPITKDLEIDIIPKAGHWIADENSVWALVFDGAAGYSQGMLSRDGIHTPE
ncbi:hypothetical protein Daesc_008936 [Daldinia eschscholtzii]|uniref:Uncharacterized protein n=1 Tax=Daldinia eschscholtzii TaxID=292717 RepID=A0AAX6M897_9PEZI